MKRIFATLTVALISILTFSACSSKLKPVTADFVKVEPQPLTLVAGKVPATITATFPPKYFNKKAILSITPELRYSGGQALGTTFKYQGEKVRENNRTVSYAEGAVIRMDESFNYVPQMERSELYLTFKVQIGKKEMRLPDVKVADGVISTEALASVGDVMPATAHDAFQRVIKEAHEASIMFLIQQANVRSSELGKTEVKDWHKTVKDASQAENKKVSVELQAYASPDGGEELNERLSASREKSTRSAVDATFRKERIGDVGVFANYTSQDWEGFKALVEKSDLQDKDLVLRVLEMYPDPESREREIKNISIVFKQLAEDILPQLRRSRLIANVEIIGKSDEEIQTLATAKPSDLNVEELLYAATLEETDEAKTKIYKDVVRLFPSDYRAYNNLGRLSYEQGDLSNAMQWFNKANELKPGNPETSMNLGLLALANGEKGKANELFGAAGSVPELAAARALLLLNEGKYADAARAYGDTKSNNAAVAQLLSGDYNKALSTLSAIAKPDATTSYLKAVVAARTNDAASVVSNMREAIRLDSRLISKAAKDLEFAKYVRNADFAALLK